MTDCTKNRNYYTMPDGRSGVKVTTQPICTNTSCPPNSEFGPVVESQSKDCLISGTNYGPFGDTRKWADKKDCYKTTWDTSIKQKCCEIPEGEEGSWATANCDPNWCKFSPSCANFSGTTCKDEILNQGVLSSDCKSWCTDNPTLCSTLKSELCRGNNLEKEICKEYCKQSGVNCDTEIQNYCSPGVALDTLQSREMCNCFLPKYFYEGYFTNLTNGLPESVAKIIRTQADKYCLYQPCLQSPYNYFRGKDGNRGCNTQITTCIQNMDIDVGGNVKGTITAEQEMNCGVGQTGKYSCVDNACKEDENGSFLSSRDCEKACGTFDCVDGVCQKAPGTSGLYDSYSTCKKVCGDVAPIAKATEKYACNGTECVLSSTGEYDSFGACFYKCSPNIPRKDGEEIVSQVNWFDDVMKDENRKKVLLVSVALALILLTVSLYM